MPRSLTLGKMEKPMSATAAPPQLLKMDQLAERLGVTRRHVRRLVDERRVPFSRLDGSCFDPAEISG
jgi:excisionase family DNA binding protein